MCGERLGAVLEGSVKGLYDARLYLVVGFAILGTDQGCHFSPLLPHSPVVLHRAGLHTSSVKQNAFVWHKAAGAPHELC